MREHLRRGTSCGGGRRGRGRERRRARFSPTAAQVAFTSGRSGGGGASMLIPQLLSQVGKDDIFQECKCLTQDLLPAHLKEAEREGEEREREERKGNKGREEKVKEGKKRRREGKGE